MADKQRKQEHFEGIFCEQVDACVCVHVCVFLVLLM